MTVNIIGVLDHTFSILVRTCHLKNMLTESVKILLTRNWYHHSRDWIHLVYQKTKAKTSGFFVRVCRTIQLQHKNATSSFRFIVITYFSPKPFSGL